MLWIVKEMSFSVYLIRMFISFGSGHIYRTYVFGLRMTGRGGVLKRLLIQNKIGNLEEKHYRDPGENSQRAGDYIWASLDNFLK